MKRVAAILIIVLLLGGCRSVKRAERRIRRIAEDYPELVQMKAHPIDTFLAVPVKADIAVLPILSIITGEIVKKKTPSGTFTAQLEGDSLLIAYTSGKDSIRYIDTIRYSQVVVSSGRQESERREMARQAIIAFGVFLGGCFLYEMLMKRRNR